MVEVQLTEEQKDFLEQCESEFKHRYTDEDADFLKVKNQEPCPPPIVDPWNTKRRPWAHPRQYQNQRRGSHQYERRNYERSQYRDRTFGRRDSY